jgi:hypothetical protein
MPHRIPTPGIKTPSVKKSPLAKVDNAHLRDMQKEAKRLKGLYDPTARPGFQYGKGTM